MFYCCIIAEYIIIIYKYGYGIICIISQSDIIIKKITIIHIYLFMMYTYICPYLILRQSPFNDRWRHELDLMSSSLIT